MKTYISERTYRAIYRLLDRVNPIDGDCGRLCGAACCTSTYEPDDIEFTAEGDVNADNYMGLYLLPGEEKVHDKNSDWIDWGHIMAEEYDFPESWEGRVYFIQCRNAPDCTREKRPIQCRTFPLAPHIDENGIFHMIMNCDELPYSCPLIDNESGEYKLNEDFVQATYTVWKHLLRDPQISDLVLMDSEIRIEDGSDIRTVK